MSFEVLLVEDSSHKRSRISEFLKTLDLDIKIAEAFSFTSGCRALEAGHDFRLVLLDLSLPTYDKTGEDDGGRFRTFGGREIARKVIRRNSKVKLLFVTQYESFPEGGRSYTFDAIKDQLKEECGTNYAGMVRYDSAKASWKEELHKALRAVLDEDTNSR